MVTAYAEDVLADCLENRSHGLRAPVATALYGIFTPEQSVGRLFKRACSAERKSTLQTKESSLFSRYFEKCENMGGTADNR